MDESMEKEPKFGNQSPEADSRERAEKNNPRSDMRSVLMLVPCDIFPPIHGSSMAVYHTVKELSRANRLEVCMSRLYSRHGDIDLVSPSINYHFVPPSFLDRAGYKGLIFNPFFYREAQSIMEKQPCDIIQAELLWAGPAGIRLKRKYKKPLILVQENVEYYKFRRMGISHPLIHGIKYLEKYCCRHADAIVAVSEEDKRILMEMYRVPEEKVVVINHCADPDVFDFREAGRDAIRKKYAVCENELVFGFVGKLDYVPNHDAVIFLAEHMKPVLKDNGIRAKFLIIGQNYKELKHYSAPDFIFTGYVDSRKGARPSLSDHLSAMDIFLVPIDSGSGTRLKILEAAACRLPIVSTQIGAEGQDFVHGEEIILVEKPDLAFIMKTVDLAQSRDLREQIGSKAREKVLGKYTWEKELKKFDILYEKFLNPISTIDC